MTELERATAAKRLEIRLRDGGRIDTRLDGDGADLTTLHRQLEQSEFVQVGDDTVVRASEVRYLRLRGDSGDGRAVPHRRPRRPQALLETKPFFLTSEFVLAFAAWVALLLTTLATDSLDAGLFTLLTVAIAAGYMLSRGFAKAHAASEAWDPREDWQPQG